MLKVRKHDGKPVSVLKNSRLMTPQAAKRTWERAWRERYGHRPPGWSKKEWGQMKHLMAWWGDERPEQFHEFLYDVVARWKVYTRTAKKTPPPMPVMGWVLAAKTLLLGRWHDQQVNNYLLLGSKVDQLVNEGLTHEEALMEAGRQEGFAKAAQKLSGMGAEVAAQVAYLEKLQRDYPELAIKAGRVSPVKPIRQVKDHWGGIDIE